MSNLITEIFNTAATDMVSSIWDLVITLIVSAVLGISIGFIYKLTHKSMHYSRSYTHSLVIVCIVISIIIVVIGSNVARAFSLAGALSIIRFRTAMRDPKDIAFIFFSMGAGLVCGSGLYIHAALFVILLSIVIFLIVKLDYGAKKEDSKILKITIPEDLNYKGLLDDILQEYLVSFSLEKVSTTGLGTLYELVYNICAKDDYDEKGMIDALRCRNGNLDISLLRCVEDL